MASDFRKADPSNYRNARDAALAEIREILQKRAALDERLERLKTTADALSALLKDTQDSPALPAANVLPQVDPFTAAMGISGLSKPGTGSILGISDAIRQAFATSRVPMSPVDIKAILASSGFKFEDYANAMSVIHNTLKRLESQGELMGLKNRVGQVAAYALRTVPPPPGSPGVPLPNQGDLADQGKGTPFPNTTSFGAGPDLIEEALGQTFKKK